MSIEGDFRAAESKFKKALQVDKLDRLAQECLTLIYEYDNGSVDKEFIVAQFKGAKAVFDKDYRKALSEFKLSLDKSPDSALANNNVGVAYLYEGAFDEAIKYFRRAISLDKKYLDGWTNLAYTYNKAKIDPQKAKECALEAI